jgi:hypothetical protein
MKRFILLTACLVLSLGCSTFTVNYDFDPEADFTQLKTFSWTPPPENSPINELTAKRIRVAVNRQLTDKGLEPASGNPDMLIVFSGGKEKRVDVEEWGYGREDRDYYGGRWYPGGLPGMPDGNNYFDYRRGVDTYEYEVGTLVLDFIDAKKKELVWRGTASGIIEPGNTAEQVNEVIGRMLSNFPPPKK